MRRDVAGQTVGCQMTASDGSDFTGSVSVYVTGDDGTQTIGSVGSGACAHKGNGYHSYTPAQDETDFAHVAFTFVGSGAVTATVQVYPSTPAPTAQDISTAVWSEEMLPSNSFPFGSAGDILDGLSAESFATAVWEYEIALVSGIPGGVGEALHNASLVSRTLAPLGSPAEYRFSPDALAGVWDVLVPVDPLLDSYGELLKYANEYAASAVAVTNKLDPMLVFDVDEYIFSEHALSNAPAGGGGGLTKSDVTEAVWDASVASHQIAGSFGEAVYLIRQDAGNVFDVIDEIVEPFGSPQELRFTSIALSAAPTSGGGPTAGDIADAVWDEARVDHQIAGSFGEAVEQTEIRGRRVVARGTVGTGSTGTLIVTSALAPAGAALDQFKGRVVLFDDNTATAELRGQGTLIESSSNDAAPSLQVVALTTAPSSGDTFSVL